MWKFLSTYWILSNKKIRTPSSFIAFLFKYCFRSDYADGLFHRECIFCRAFSLGLDPKECETRCVHLNLTLVGHAGVLATVPPYPGRHRCMEVDSEACRVHFLLQSRQKGGSVHAHVALERGKQTKFSISLWNNGTFQYILSENKVVFYIKHFKCVLFADGVRHGSLYNKTNQPITWIKAQTKIKNIDF